METIISPDTFNKIIGPIACKYLPRANDNKFNLYWNKNSFMISNSIVRIDHTDVVINNEMYN